MTPLTEVPQLLVNGVMAGTILAVPAIGLTAIYAVLRFPNFAIASHPLSRSPSSCTYTVSQS